MYFETLLGHLLLDCVHVSLKLAIVFRGKLAYKLSVVVISFQKSIRWQRLKICAINLPFTEARLSLL